MTSTEPPPAYASRHDHLLLMTSAIKSSIITTTDFIEDDSLQHTSPPEYILHRIDSLSPPPLSNINLTNQPLSYHIKRHIIHASDSKSSQDTTTTPQYHLYLDLTPKNKPKSLKIRRLLPSDLKKLTSNPCNSLPFDEDTLLYTSQNRPSYFATRKSHVIEIRGRQAATLKGMLEIPPASGISGSQRVWHVTRNPVGDYLREENERRMERYGYRPEEESRREVLFEIGRRKGGGWEWRGRDGVVIAVEGSGRLGLLNGDLERRVRDVLVFCWCVRLLGKGELDEGACE